jgi:hypothetical protein
MERSFHIHSIHDGNLNVRLSILTWSLKAGIVELKETAIAGRWLGKHVPAATDMDTTIEELLEAVFCMRSMLNLYKDQQDSKMCHH